MKQFYLIGVIFMASFTSYAQSITVLDSARKLSVPGATVMLLNQTTGKIEKHGATDAAGAFAFSKTTEDVFLLSVTATGYKKAVVKLTSNNQILFLAPDTKQLKEVKITSGKSPIKFNGNVMEFDISQVPNADYLNLSDIIDHLPFLQVTDKGEIKMMDETLTILIDNKPNIIYKDAASLKSLPPQAIEKMELTLTPTARNGGKTLNITLKHDYFLGWNGSVDVSGSRLGYNPVASVSYWRKKFGVDASANYTYSNASNANTTAIDYLQPQSTLNSIAKSQAISNRGGFNLSSFYNMSDVNSLDLQFNISPSKTYSLTNSTIIRETTGIQDIAFSALTSNSTSLSYNVSLNYTHKGNKSGDVFYLLSRFYTTSPDRDQLLTNSGANNNLLPDNSFASHSMSNEGTVEIITQHNSNKKFRYTIGTKLILRNYKSDNTTNINNIITTSPFNMQQWVSSTYADADWSVKKLTAHTGIRLDYNINSYRAPVIPQKEFLNLTPDISLTYNINPANLLMLTYGRRVYRPGAVYINPVTTSSNAYQQKGGNEDLGNQISNNWGLQYYGNYKAARIGFNFSYSNLRGSLSDISSLDNAGIIQTISTNADLNQSFTAGFSADFSFLKKFRFSHFNNYSYNIQSGMYTSHIWSGYLTDRLSYQPDKQNSLDLSMQAQSPNTSLQGRDQYQAFLYWGLNYGHYFDWMKKFPTAIHINITTPDRYNGLPGYSTVTAPNFSMRQDTWRENPVISVSVRVQIKGKQSGNRTFNKTKSIQNTDLSQ